MRRKGFEGRKNPWVIGGIAAVIMFIFSLIVDFITGKSLDYGYAILLAVIFAAVFIALQSFFNYMMGR